MKRIPIAEAGELRVGDVVWIGTWQATVTDKARLSYQLRLSWFGHDSLEQMGATVEPGGAIYELHQKNLDAAHQAGKAEGVAEERARVIGVIREVVPKNIRGPNADNVIQNMVTQLTAAIRSTPQPPSTPEPPAEDTKNETIPI